MKTMVLAALCLCSQAAFSQTQLDSWDNLRQLQPGQKIEVIDLANKSTKGEFIVFSSNEISLRTDRGAFSLLRTQVRTVKNREKNHRARNAVLGALLGAAAGAATGAAVTSAVADSTEISYGTLIGFAIGAGVGTAAGTSRPSPATIYRAP